MKIWLVYTITNVWRFLLFFFFPFFYRLRESTTVNLIVEMDRFCSIIAVLWHFGQWGKWMNNFLSFPVQMQVWYWSLMRAYFARSTFLHQVFMLKNVWPPCQLILHVCVRTTENKQYSKTNRPDLTNLMKVNRKRNLIFVCL